jgi:serine protease Do
MRLPASISNCRALRSGAALGGLVLAGALVFEAATCVGGLLESIDSEVCSIFDKSKPAVVKVHATRTMPASGLPLLPAHRVGTGFFISEEGCLLTSASVVEDATECWIDWQGRRVPARIVGRDAGSGIAMLAVDPQQCAGPQEKLPFLVKGNSDDLRVGSMVIAVGYPYDLPSAPSVGFVTGMDIQRGGRPFATTHIRTGCRLSPGQGGGPVLNTRGEVVGIAVAAHPDGHSYALPIGAAAKVCAEFEKYGCARRGWVGLSVGERRKVWPEAGLTETHVYVRQVFSNTPAAEVGFRDGDILIRIQTNDVPRIADVLNTMFYSRVGDRLMFTVLREGQTNDLTLTVGERPVEEPLVAQQDRPALDPLRGRPTIVPAAGTR